MSVFSIYTGLIYNDVFSKAMTLFNSAYKWEYHADNGKWVGNKVRWYPYIIGVDYAWHGAENSLLFSNSYKMKMSILFGVMQMTFGVVLSLYNFKFFKKNLDIYANFIPQIIFLEAIFGYLAILIMYKWIFWTDRATAPGLLNTLIYMFLRPGTVEMPLYPGQVSLL
jgi:V-type H+-transporting ATPase subunit a